MSARNWKRAAVLELVIVVGWVLSLAVPWLGYMLGIGAGAFWLRTLEIVDKEDRPPAAFKED